MIKLNSDPTENLFCPVCKSCLNDTEIIFAGLRTFNSGFCKKCNDTFYIDAPIGHGTMYSFSISEKNNNVYPKDKQNWYSEFLKKSLITKLKEINYDISVVKKTISYNKLIILNCIDCYYGHSLLKLFNVQYYYDNFPDYDTLVIIPKFLLWLVPKNIKNVISIDIPLREGYFWINNLDIVIKKVMSNYKEVHLSKAYSHPHPKNYNISFFSDVKPMNERELINISNSVNVTFIWRKDRLCNFNLLKQMLIKINKKSKLYLFEKLALKIQRKDVLKLYHLLKKEFKEVNFNIIGFKDSVTFPDFINDCRVLEMSESKEIEWLRIYSSSHLCIGIHGSNMLLPSMFSGMILELLPNQRLGNYLQDILFKNEDIRSSHFKIRFIPEDVSIQNMALVAISMLKDYKEFNYGMNELIH